MYAVRPVPVLELCTITIPGKETARDFDIPVAMQAKTFSEVKTLVRLCANMTAVSASTAVNSLTKKNKQVTIVLNEKKKL